MFHTSQPGKSFINEAEYRDKVLGCWTGKNIGGTLGAPLEGKRDIFDVEFYLQDLQGNPAPNDDLDLQLIWLKAVEDHGIYRINERLLGEYWLAYITGPWNEYGVCKYNMACGLVPPLSGSCGNDQWKNSNGAWIRSEIWACLFPGEPDEALPFAWADACVDHADDGIYAELFTTALESAAFVESDLRKLIDCALCRIPVDCRIAQSVKIAIDEYDAGHDWQTARNRIVEDNTDLGWFQAPANVAFVIIGLLYGEGDFGKSICIATNCGDDTDCTAATCGSILGIILGRSGIPSKWIEPIGDAIKTVAIDRFQSTPPETLTTLTERVILCKKDADHVNLTLLRLTSGETVFDAALLNQLANGEETRKRVLTRSSTAFETELPIGVLEVAFDRAPELTPGEEIGITLSLRGTMTNCRVVTFDWQLPDGWHIAEGLSQSVMGMMGATFSTSIRLTAGDYSGMMEFVPLTVRLSDRMTPYYTTVPFRRVGATGVKTGTADQTYWDARNRRQAMMAEVLK